MIYMSYLSIKTYKENIYDISQYSVYVKNVTLPQKAPELYIICDIYNIYNIYDLYVIFIN